MITSIEPFSNLNSICVLDYVLDYVLIMSLTHSWWPQMLASSLVLTRSVVAVDVVIGIQIQMNRLQFFFLTRKESVWECYTSVCVCVWVCIWSEELSKKPYKPFMKPSPLKNSEINMRHRSPGSDTHKLRKGSAPLSPVSERLHLLISASI